jgi:hypothetical protein
MTPRSGLLDDIARYLLALLLVVIAPAIGTGQAPKRDTTTATAPVKDLPLSAAERQAFVGTYRTALPHGEERTLRIIEENGVLKGYTVEEPSDKGPRRLLYQGDNTFRPEGIPDFLFVFIVENGRATKFTGRREDGVMEGVRVP